MVHTENSGILYEVEKRETFHVAPMVSVLEAYVDSDGLENEEKDP